MICGFSSFNSQTLNYTVTPVSRSLSPGIRRRKDFFREDPRSMGSVGHLRRRAQDQGPVQGQRHPRQQRDAHELAVHAFSPARARHAP